MKKDSLAKFGPVLWDISVRYLNLTKARSRNFTLAYASQKAKLFAAVAATTWTLRLNNIQTVLLQ